MAVLFNNVWERIDLKIITLAGREKEWIDQLRALSEASGLAVMADFFRHKSDKPVIESPAPAPIASADHVNALDALCQTQDCLWWTQGTSLLFRSRAWYDIRRYEISTRWLSDVSKHLQAQHGVPMYADVLRLLELTPEQIIGLQSGFYNGENSGHGGGAEEKELVEAHSLLEILRENASPQGNRVPVPGWNDLCRHNADKTLAQVILSYDTMTLAQRGQIPAYLQAQPHRFTPQEQTDFFAVVYRPEETARTGAGGYKNVSIRVFDGFGTGLLKARDPLAEMQTHGGNAVVLTLPLTLPDDRRGNTRIEVAP